MKVKEAYDPETIFGDLSEKIVWSNDSILMTDDIITITNNNCEFDFDSISGEFLTEPAYFCFKVELEILKVDTSNYVPEKSNNGGCYAFAQCKVVKILEEGY